MGLYEPKNCCICFDTKIGSLILGSVSLIYSILTILTVVCGLLDGFFEYLLQNRFEHLPQNYHLDPQVLKNIIVYVCIAIIAIKTIIGVCSSLLIHGIRKDRPGLMMPYLVLQRIGIIMAIIAILLGTALAIHQLDPARFMYHTVPLTLLATLMIYSHCVINAYHKQVKRAVGGEKVYYKEFHNDCNDYKGKV